METFPQATKGKKAFVMNDGTVKHYDGIIPPLNWFGLIEFQFLLWGVKSWQDSFPLDREIELWDHPRAKGKKDINNK